MQEQDAVLDFWFSPDSKKFWFARSSDFDAKVRDVLGPFYERAKKGELETWKNDPRGALALVILFDQAPRNLHRGSPESFATDARALETARAAIAKNFDQGYSIDERVFLYLPFEHSEDLATQRESMALFERLGNESYLKYATAHFKIIEKYGRFPHRNAVVGRESTPEELEFLKQPGSSF